MKEKPLLFSEPMVRAIQEGRKTQTRRVVKPQPEYQGFDGPPQYLSSTGEFRYPAHRGWRCPYGNLGDRLWVKESHYQYGRWQKNGLTKTGKTRWRFIADKTQGAKYTDDPPAEICTKKDEVGWFKRNSLFMPRWASRITLEIAAVRVELLQDISEGDAKAEGIEREFAHGEDLGWKNYLWHGHFGKYGLGDKNSDEWVHQYSTYADGKEVGSYSSLWQLINGPGSWEKNPWVWVIEFRQICA